MSGRFLAATPTGLHRVARALVTAADTLGWDRRIVAPAGTSDPLVDATLRVPPVPGAGHLFEQLALPVAARGRPVLYLTNTAPVLPSHNVVLVHDLAPLVGPAWFQPRLRWYGRAVLAGARAADLVLTVSQAVAGDLAAAGVRAPIRVVRPSVGHLAGPAAAPAVAAVRRDLGLGDEPYLVLVGWADPRKDAVTAVTASLLARREADHRLVLVGLPHPTFAPVTIPADDGIVRAGYVPDEQLRALLTGAAALVYPSRYEGFGLPPLEALACGTPALVSDLPVLRESTGGRATFVPAGDVDAWAAAITRAVSDPSPVPAAPRWMWTDAAEQLLGALAEYGGSPPPP